MAFNNVTFFELHLDDARFGGIGDPEGSDDEAHETEYESEGESAETAGETTQGGVGVGRAVFVLGLFALSAALARRLAARRGGDGDAEVEMHLEEAADAAAESVEVVD